MSNINKAVLKVAQSNPEFRRALIAELNHPSEGEKILEEIIAAVPSVTLPKRKSQYPPWEGSIEFGKGEVVKMMSPKRGKDTFKVGITALVTHEMVTMRIDEKLVPSYRYSEAKKYQKEYKKIAQEILRQHRSQLVQHLKDLWKRAGAAHRGTGTELARRLWRNNRLLQDGPNADSTWAQTPPVIKLTGIKFKPFPSSGGLQYNFRWTGKIAAVLEAKMTPTEGVYNKMSDRELKELLSESDEYMEGIHMHVAEWGASTDERWTQADARRFTQQLVDRDFPGWARGLRNRSPDEQAKHRKYLY